MGLANYMFDHGDSLTLLVLMSLYATAMAGANHLTARYL